VFKSYYAPERTPFSDWMKSIIFDLDGVLIDTMPTHYKAMRIAFKEATGIDLDKKTFYLLEGMPITEMALRLFELKGYYIGDMIVAKQLAKQVAHRKKELVLQTKIIPKPFSGVRELLNYELGSSNGKNCLKAVVSGSSKQEIDLVINTYFGIHNFDAVVTGDEFEGRGKPNPAPFNAAVRKLSDVAPITDIIIVENAPLGVKAANAAKIKSIVALNTSQLTLADFKGLINGDRIFRDTASAGIFLKNWVGYINE
jgi:beta-phosphoglucomutase